MLLRVSTSGNSLVLLCPSSNSCFFPFPSEGYVYLVFESEKSVRALLQACSQDLLSPDGLSEYYFKMSSRRMRCKEVSGALLASAGDADGSPGDDGLLPSVTLLQQSRVKAAAEVRTAAEPAAFALTHKQVSWVSSALEVLVLPEAWLGLPVTGPYWCSCMSVWSWLWLSSP